MKCGGFSVTSLPIFQNSAISERKRLFQLFPASFQCAVSLLGTLPPVYGASTVGLSRTILALGHADCLNFASKKQHRNQNLHGRFRTCRSDKIHKHIIFIG
jgi:hypothetical protein